jgi:hypothetical protein
VREHDRFGTIAVQSAAGIGMDEGLCTDLAWEPEQDLLWVVAAPAKVRGYSLYLNDPLDGP